MNFESDSIGAETEYDDHESKQAGDESESAAEFVNAPSEPSSDISRDDSEPPETVPEPKPRLPRAGTAFLAFATFILTQLVAGIFVVIGAWIYAVAALGLKPDEAGFMDFIMQTTLYSAVPISILAGYAVLMVTRWLARDVITDGEITGVGWVESSPLRCLLGAALGVAICCSTTFLMITLFPNLEPEAGPLDDMFNQGGVMLLLLIILALVLAPLVEEFLFRGVMLAGFTRSFGFPLAVFFCTSLFVLLHFDAILRYTPAVIPLTGISLALVFLRVKFKSLWPAIAAHFGYNGMALLVPTILELISSAE
ncbi:MAG TPA: CPBP family intramembrane metalloprotease [Planctomycetes bacterium]|nr:CPBP family intramembrane metalloprotease [Planctomycetota bacterium]